MMLVIDATHLLRTFYEVVKRSDEHELADTVEMFLNRIEKIRERLYGQNLSYCVCVFDNQKETFRHWLFDGYKAGREVDLDWQEVDDWAKHAVSKSADWLPVVASYGYEADDVIASIASHQKRIRKVLIHAADKDLNQCLDDGLVSICKNSRIDERSHQPNMIYLTASMLESEYGFGPDRWIDYQALCGDSCDSIVGAVGVGDVTARKLIQENEKLEDIDPDQLNKTQRENWDDFLNRLPMLRKLLTLKTEMDMPAELPG